MYANKKNIKRGVITVVLALLTQPAFATAVDIRLFGTIEGGPVANGSVINFDPVQQDFLNNINTGSISNDSDGTPFDFTFRFDTDTSYVSGSGWAATLLSASIGSMTDFSMYTTWATTYGTNASGHDVLRFTHYRDLDEELGYRGDWFIQNYFEILDFDGDMFAAMANSESVPFDNSIIDAAQVEFRAHRNRNGLYYRYYFATAGVDVNAANSSTGGGTASAPEPATLALMGLGLAGLGLTGRKRNR